MNGNCKCGNPVRSKGQRYCRRCHAESMKRTRPVYADMPEHRRQRMIATAYLHVYLKRGKIERGHCIFCGSDRKIRGYHPDPYRPLEVFWMCQEHLNDYLRTLKRRAWSQWPKGSATTLPADLFNVRATWNITSPA